MSTQDRALMKSKWFNFRQNNSGGIFRDPAINVWVEARDAEEANKRAASIGLYFDGDGDCSCCGNRWHEQWSDDRGEDACPAVLSPNRSEDGYSTEDALPRAVRFGYSDRDPVVIPIDKSLPDEWDADMERWRKERAAREAK